MLRCMPGSYHKDAVDTPRLRSLHKGPLGRLTQRESDSFTRNKSQVQSLQRPQEKRSVAKAPAVSVFGEHQTRSPIMLSGRVLRTDRSSRTTPSQTKRSNGMYCSPV